MSEASSGAAAPPPDVADEPPLPPARLTYALLVLLALVFAGELLLPAGRNEDWISPSVQTLVAWGAMSQPMVLGKGEWFRLGTAALLHGGPGHLAMNALALLMAGSALELLIGRLWLAALLVLGALGGGLASVWFNDSGIVGVGASGAIMALFGFFLTIAFRFEKGPLRRAFLANSLGALIPSLLPGLIPASGFQIDYAAHAGGALAGAALGLLFVLVWREEAPRPPLRALALAIVLAGAAALAVAVPRLVAAFPEARFIGSLMPESAIPATDEAARAAADDLIRRYPEDPRGYYYKGLTLAARNDAAGAEQALGRAVALAERYPGVFFESFRARLRALHALALHGLKRDAEARAVIAPVCGQSAARDLLGTLRREGLCR